MVRCFALALAGICSLLLPDGLTAQEKKGESRIVAKILKVETLVEESAPPTLVVNVHGRVPTGGYSNITLVRAVYTQPPQDGIQDYFLLATPPTGIATQALVEVKASHRWKGYSKEAPWLKGIRVHGVGDGVVVKMVK